MVNRIGTFANASALIQASMNVQAKLAQQQTQEATTVKATTFGGLGGDAGKLLPAHALLLAQLPQTAGEPIAVRHVTPRKEE